MNNEQTMMPDAVRIEYLRGYRAGLLDARLALHLTPYDHISNRMDETAEEIKKIEARTK